MRLHATTDRYAATIAHAHALRRAASSRFWRGVARRVRAVLGLQRVRLPRTLEAI